MNLSLPARLTLILATLPQIALALTPSQVFDKVKDSVVVVKTLNAKGEQISFGSGVLLPSGQIATNCHVVKGGVNFKVGRGKGLKSATFYSGDDDKDICLLQADKLGGTPAQLGKAAALKVGEAVYAIGAPQGLELSMSDGIVSALRGASPPLIQTTAAISHGSSGGGLFDSQGRLVGFTTLYLKDGQSLNFAMPVEWLADIKSGKRTASNKRSNIEWISNVAALEEKKDWPKLLDLGNQWIKAEPQNEVAWYAVGSAQLSLKRFDQAVIAFRKGVGINPTFGVAWYNLGVTYTVLERYDDAMSALREFLRIDPDHAKAWNLLGFTYNKLKRYDDALAAYREALRINPEYDDALENLGSTYYDLKRYREAISAYREALRIDPEDAVAWFNLGNNYNKLNIYYLHHDAIAAFREALRINPEDAEAWYAIGITYGVLQRNEDAIAAFREALRINPTDADAWYYLGVTFFSSGNTPAALQVVKSLRSLDTAKANELFNLIVPR